jgi:myo-inositol-1(or 4)-monophosphatase
VPGEPPSTTPTGAAAVPPATELAGLAERLAVEAAALLRPAWEARRGASAAVRGVTAVSSKSSATDQVSEWDRAAEQVIRDGLARSRPRDAVLGEEGGRTEGTSGVRWIVDPLDGTTNFLYGLAPFGVSIAAAHGEQVIAGAVVDVAHDEVFVAARGKGARCNGLPVSPSGCTELSMALLGTGFAYDAARRGRQGAVMAAVLPEVRDLRRAGAAAVDLCWVASGRLDAFFERGLAPWDLAAGGLIAAEAGAVVRGLDGGPPSGEGVLAAAPGIAEQLRSLLVQAGGAEA